MARKYHFTFAFADTETAAMTLCDNVFKAYSPYMRSRYGKPSFTNWSSSNGKESRFVVWFYE